MEEKPEEEKKLSCQGCGKATNANLCCPECVKLGRTTYFCDQKCFTSNWASHCELHKIIEQQKAIEEARRERDEDPNSMGTKLLYDTLDKPPKKTGQREKGWALSGDASSNNATNAYRRPQRMERRSSAAAQRRATQNDKRRKNDDVALDVAMIVSSMKAKPMVTTWLLLAMILAALFLRRRSGDVGSSGVINAEGVAGDMTARGVDVSTAMALDRKLERLTKELSLLRGHLNRHDMMLDELAEAAGIQDKWEEKKKAREAGGGEGKGKRAKRDHGRDHDAIQSPEELVTLGEEQTADAVKAAAGAKEKAEAASANTATKLRGEEGGGGARASSQVVMGPPPAADPMSYHTPAPVSHIPAAAAEQKPPKKDKGHVDDAASGGGAGTGADGGEGVGAEAVVGAKAAEVGDKSTGAMEGDSGADGVAMAAGKDSPRKKKTSGAGVGQGLGGLPG